jgi:hypothetical protein
VSCKTMVILILFIQLPQRCCVTALCISVDQILGILANKTYR